MATAKIATLAIRTLAKPIATQLKNQAAQHETFRNICISLAQRMHRTEMALRANLLPTGGTQKVRPLNDAKAIANGANAISEGFLFFVAATLILGETYRGSRKKAEQRDRTEEEVGRLRDLTTRLAARVGVDIDEVERELDAEKNCNDADVKPAEFEDGEAGTAPSQFSVRLASQAEEVRTRQLQSAVEVLLKLAIKNGWIAGEEALQLDGIMRDPIDPTAASTLSSSSASPNPPGAVTTPGEEISSPSVIQRVALERARALAREVRGAPEPSTPPTATTGQGLEEAILLGASGLRPPLQPQQQQRASTSADASLSDLYDLLVKINQETSNQETP
ncbi:hypothetical protein ACQY0O_001264 [Thecaphora frezii]